MADFSKLKSQLLTSGIQKDNNALYQVIWNLIDFAQKAISSIQSVQSLITTTNESSTIPNSRQIVAGSGVSLMDNGRQIMVSSVVLPASENVVYESYFPMVATTVITGAP